MLEARKLRGPANEFLPSYHDTRRRESFPHEVLGLETSIPLANFQLLIERVARKYCKDMLSENPVDGEKILGYREPTGTEMKRVMRGLIRFEMFCMIFGGRSRDTSYSPISISGLFLSKFAVWEVEEIACIGKYILDQYDDTLSYYGNTDPAKDYQRQKHKSGMLPLTWGWVD